MILLLRVFPKEEKFSKCASSLLREDGDTVGIPLTDFRVPEIIECVT